VLLAQMISLSSFNSFGNSLGGCPSELTSMPVKRKNSTSRQRLHAFHIKAWSADKSFEESVGYDQEELF
jgi:hypothetical protein